MGLGFGVSDDVFGSAVASFWTFYNMGLVWYVLRLAMRPPQKRRAPRFRVNFPVRLAGEPGLGMTGDFSEGGCTVLWVAPFPIGAMLDLEMHVGGRTISKRGEVVAHHPRSEGWAVNGIRFVHLGQAEIDALNDAIFQFAVPSLFERLSEPWWLGRIVRRLKTQRDHSRETWRRGEILPLRVRHAGGSFLAVTRDESGGGLGFVSPRPLGPGAAIIVDVAEPRGERRLRLTVARCRQLPTSGAYPAWLIGARVDRGAWRAGRRDGEEAATEAA
jgi:hypothetical protein